LVCYLMKVTLTRLRVLRNFLLSLHFRKNFCIINAERDLTKWEWRIRAIIPRPRVCKRRIDLVISRYFNNIQLWFDIIFYETKVLWKLTFFLRINLLKFFCIKIAAFSARNLCAWRRAKKLRTSLCTILTLLMILRYRLGEKREK